MVDIHIVDTLPHLGGNAYGGDPGTFEPRVWDLLVSTLGLKSVLDVGCGEGHALSYMKDKLNCSVLGIEGLAENIPYISAKNVEAILCDVTVQVPDVPQCDLVWSCEFVEHVDEKYINNILRLFEAGRVIAMTHAVPGQGGHHHVNCKPSSYWVSRIESIGYEFDPELTTRCRVFAMGPYFKQSGLVFTRCKSIISYASKVCNVPDPVAFEIGTSIGQDTPRLLGVMPKATRYFAFEPDPRNAAAFRGSINDPRVSFHEMAVGNADGQVEFHMSSGRNHDQPEGYVHTHSGSILEPLQHLKTHPWCKFDETVTVDVTKLDSFCAANGISHIDFIWADIQGAEAEMIRGGQSILQKTRYIYMECSEVEYYKGALGVNGLMGLLPGKWRLVENFGTDILVINVSYQA